MMLKNKRGIHMLLFWLEEKEHLDLWTTVTVRRQEEDQVKRKEKQEKAKIKLVQTKFREVRETHLLLHVHPLRHLSLSILFRSLVLAPDVLSLVIFCRRRRGFSFDADQFSGNILSLIPRGKKKKKNNIRLFGWSVQFMQIVVTNVLWQVVYVCLHIYTDTSIHLWCLKEIETRNNDRQKKKEDSAPGSFYHVSMYVLLFV